MCNLAHNAIIWHILTICNISSFIISIEEWNGNRVFIESYQDNVSLLQVQMGLQKGSGIIKFRLNLKKTKKQIGYWKFLATCLITYISIDALKKSEQIKFYQNKMPIPSIKNNELIVFDVIYYLCILVF